MGERERSMSGRKTGRQGWEREREREREKDSKRDRGSREIERKIGWEKERDRKRREREVWEKVTEGV